jgi:hypothetical protein
MSYKSISEGHNCKCLIDAHDNNKDTFARKVGDTKDFKIRDFKTHHERGKILETESCEDICGFRGLSVELWNEESKDYVIDKFSLTVKLAPMKKPSHQIGVFKIVENAGKVKHTPNQRHGQEIYHHDLYKSDTFVIENLEIIEMIPLFNPNV